MSKRLSLYKKYYKLASTYYDFIKQFIAESKNNEVPKVIKMVKPEEQRKIVEMQKKVEEAEKEWREAK